MGSLSPKGVARLDFIAHKARHKHRDRRPGVDVFWLERMRNAWTAYHAGAVWMDTDWGYRHPDGNGGSRSSDFHRGVAHGRASGSIMLDESRVREARLRAEVEQVCTLLYESTQDGEDLGPEGSAWAGADGARRWAERIKGAMAELANLRAGAFPDEDPENLAGAYGDGLDAMLGTVARLTEERDDARAEGVPKTPARPDYESLARRAESGELSTFGVDEGAAEHTEACRVADVAAWLRALTREDGEG